MGRILSSVEFFRFGSWRIPLDFRKHHRDSSGHQLTSSAGTGREVLLQRPREEEPAARGRRSSIISTFVIMFQAAVTSEEHIGELVGAPPVGPNWLEQIRFCILFPSCL